MQKKVEKRWGYELWFENNNKYCGKLLFIKYGNWSSQGNFHYHKLKDETFFVIEGKLLLNWVVQNKIYAKVLQKYDSFRIKPLLKHRFYGISSEGCKFIEASTTHSDKDSYYCRWDSENEKWFEF